MKKACSFLFLFMFLAMESSAFAMPTFSSKEDTIFIQNINFSRLSDITITDDATTPFIKANNDIRIHIPSDIWMIFDKTKMSLDGIYIDGTAVTSGKVLSNPTLTYEDNDKTVVIPVEKDFAAGESITIYSLYGEGFNNYSSIPSYLEFIYDKTKDAITDPKYINVNQSSSTTYKDKRAPEAISNVKMTQTSNTSVKLTWDNPPDLDVRTINILRGLNYMPVSSTPYVQIGAPTKEYADTSLKVGDTVKYQLGCDDENGNVSEYTKVYEYKMVEYVTTPEPKVCTTEVSQVCGKDGKTYSNECVAKEQNKVEVDYVGECKIKTEQKTEPSFSDIGNNPYKDQIIEMAKLNIVKGDPDNKFRPADGLNRAESATLLFRVLKMELPTSVSEKPFPDVEVGAWYAPYISLLKIQKLIKGDNKGYYNPGNKINNAEFLTLAMNVYYNLADTAKKTEIDNYKKETASLSYADVSQNVWYAPNVIAATKLGFIKGETCGNGKCFHPGKEITRDKAAKLLYDMFYGILKK